MKMFRQGDLLFLKVEKNTLPKNLTPIANNVILRGEATGHSHRLVNGQLFRSLYGNILPPIANPLSTSNMVVQAQQGTKVIHEEHAIIELEIGFYMVIRQREYSPWRFTNVMD